MGVVAITAARAGAKVQAIDFTSGLLDQAPARAAGSFAAPTYSSTRWTGFPFLQLHSTKYRTSRRPNLLVRMKAIGAEAAPGAFKVLIGWMNVRPVAPGTQCLRLGTRRRSAHHFLPNPPRRS